eukprot:XP_011602762.1 PREDICTED: Sjoegren syndrome nuclear autoantigen 1 homolog isoform X1 [Takifugu rubripes]
MLCQIVIISCLTLQPLSSFGFTGIDPACLGFCFFVSTLPRMDQHKAPRHWFTSRGLRWFCSSMRLCPPHSLQRVPVHLRKEFTMTHQAAALQTYNNELIKVLDDLHSRREDLNRHIRQDEEEKEQLQQDSQVLSDKLRRVSENLSQRLAARAAFDRTIAETEAAYNMILESSQSLLCLLKKEAENLNKATDPRRKVH